MLLPRHRDIKNECDAIVFQEITVTLDAEDTEHIEAEFASRLKVYVEQAVENNSGLAGSNTWLLLNALISCDNNDPQSLIAHFEQSGCLLAEQGVLTVGVS